MSDTTTGVLITVGVVALSLVIVAFAIRSITKVTGTIKNAVAGTAVVRGFSETGTTVSAPNIGPEAPVYALDLLVTPPTGAAYAVESRQAVPRIVLPFFVPGIVVPVDIDPADPNHVKVSWKRFDAGAAPVGPGDLVAAVRTGAIPRHYGSAAELLASGARGTGVVTTAMPLGMRVRDANPGADPRYLDDPLWLFTLEVTLPGRPPFPSVFGHRVPPARLGQVAPGLTLPVAVNLANPNQECAIDWDAVPA